MKSRIKKIKERLNKIQENYNSKDRDDKIKYIYRNHLNSINKEFHKGNYDQVDKILNKLENLLDNENKKKKHLDNKLSVKGSRQEVTADCELTVNMVDTYGDGWGANNNLEISVNDVAIKGSPFTVYITTNSVTLETNYGDLVSFNVVGGGSWTDEMEVTIGDTVLGAGDTYTFECIDPDAVYFDASVTTNGVLAIFSFTVDNFTVGAAGEGDGHIHWSIFYSSDLTNAIDSDMLYSTEGINVSLPNGNYTMVFSLVNPNHQPLDPAVEATVEFSTFDGTVACGETFTTCYDSDTSGAYSNDAPLSLFSSTGNAGDVVSVTFGGVTETNYDYVIVTNGAGVQIGDPLTGDLNGVVVTSDDGTINVGLNADYSLSCVSDGFDSLSATVSCVTPVTYDVTFSVNTENITVGENGMYAGGGVLGGATAYAMTDDGTGTWTVTIPLKAGTSGNYIFLNSPNNDGDWGAKEILSGQECADAANNNDRILPNINGNMTIQHCFGSCETDGTCPTPPETYNITFQVDMNSVEPTAFTTPEVNGTFNAWCGGCGAMSDADGDNVWEFTTSLAQGYYEYKFAADAWTSQEELEVVSGCTVTDGSLTNRSLNVSGDSTLGIVCWNSCTACTTGPVLSQIDLPITWDDDTVDYTVESFGGTISSLSADPNDSSNTVLMVNKTAGSVPWAGTILSTQSGLANSIQFVDGATTISARVYSPATGVVVRLKAEDHTDPSISVETEATTTIENGWDTLVFDFSNEVDSTTPINFSNTYDKLVIIFDFGNVPSKDTIYYLDNVNFGVNGCTYSNATNYDVNASLDDGSCTFENSCPADLNGDGTVTISDLLAFLSLFGTTC